MKLACTKNLAHILIGKASQGSTKLSGFPSQENLPIPFSAYMKNNLRGPIRRWENEIMKFIIDFIIKIKPHIKSRNLFTEPALEHSFESTFQSSF